VAAGAWVGLDPAALGSLLVRLAAKELLHDPHDRVAATLRTSPTISMATHRFLRST